MESQQQHPAPVTALALTNRQLTDWQNALADFEARNAPDEQLAYCRRQIDRLKEELKALES